MNRGTTDLAMRCLSYDAVGATRPESQSWAPPPGYRAFDKTRHVGAGSECWKNASAVLLSWGVKTRSGFRVEPTVAEGKTVQPDERYWLLARLGPLMVREPAQVVAVVDHSDRCGFAYGTLTGHPLSGEEAFILHRDGQGVVSLTVRSLTRPGRGVWRLAFPAALAAQRWYRHRYFQALSSRHAHSARGVM